jgi:hypothetical protein
MSCRSVGLLVVCLLVSVVCVAQPQNVQASAKAGPAATTNQSKVTKADHHLTRVETITSPTENLSVFRPPLACDADGNLYFQTDPTAPAIYKLNPKGERVVSFQASANPDLKVDFSRSFTVTTSGEVYELIFAHEINRYVFVYKADGSLRSTIKLQPGFAWAPKAMGVFSNGTMLIAGGEYDKDPTAALWPFTGIFDSYGTLLKEIKLEDDDTLRTMAESGDARVTNPLVPGANRALDMTRIQIGGDGNAYLMRWTNPAVVYAISPGGEVLRRFIVDPGDQGFKPVATHILENRMAVYFVNTQTADKLMKIVDLDGHPMATYDELRKDGKPVSDTVGTAFVCYTQNPERFTFLGSSEAGKLQLWISEPK